MNFNLKVTVSILIISSALGLVMNTLNSKGIPLVREERQLAWAEDSLLIDAMSNNTETDSIALDHNAKKLNGQEVSEDISAQYQDEKKDNNQTAEEEKKLIQKDPLPPGKDTLKTELKEPLNITLSQANSLYKRGVLFIDARDPSDFKYGHIKGAINFPYDLFNEYKDIMKSVPKNKPVVVYCGGSDCDLSHLLGNELFKMGYNEVYIFFGGWNEWVEAEYPVESINE